MGYEDFHYLSESEYMEKIFNEDCRDKKIIARGIHNRASRKTGLRRGVTFYSDLLKGKDKKNYTKAGEIRVQNIGEFYTESINKLPKLEKIEEMGFDTAKTIILAALAKFTKTELCKHWKINDYQYYQKVVPKYGIQTNKERNGRALKPASDDIPTLKQIYALSNEDAIQMLKDLKKNYTIKTLTSYWGISKFLWKNSVLKRYGLENWEELDDIEEAPKSKKPKLKNELVNENKKDNDMKTNVFTTFSEPILTSVPTQTSNGTNYSYYQPIQYAPLEQPKAKEEEFEGYKVTMNGTYLKERMENRMLRLVETLETDKKYKVKLEIIELEDEIEMQKVEEKQG